MVPTPVADHYVTGERLGETQEAYPLDLYLCRGCGHVQMLDVVDPDVLFRDYVYMTSFSLGLVEHFKELASRLMDLQNLQRGSLVLEIGSNDGSMLRAFKERGFSVLGIDPARDIARKATESGIETLPEFFTSDLAGRIAKEHGPASIVIANNVFAHADELGDIADGIRELLSGDGVFVFEVSYLVDIVGKMLFDTIYHEHLCYHSVKPLQRFFREHGMELIDVERIPSKGGSIRGLAQRAGGPKKTSPEVAGLTRLEEELGMEKAATYGKMSARILEMKSELGSFLSEMLSQGKVIAGYGASATVTTLLYQFDLGDKLSFLVDDNPARHGLFSPGHHLPVFPSSELLERKPDYVVVLAWAYADPIPACAAIKDHIAFYWGRMDVWFVGDKPVSAPPA